MTEFSVEHEPEHEQLLDRKEIAVTLRKLGMDVDFEDWDGLDDNDVLGYITTLAPMYDYDIDDILSVTAPIIDRNIEQDGGEIDEV